MHQTAGSPFKFRPLTPPPRMTVLLLLGLLLPLPAVPGEDRSLPAGAPARVAAVKGDLNGDGLADETDAAILAAYLAAVTASLPAGTDPDMDGSGDAGATDLVLQLTWDSIFQDDIVGILVYVAPGIVTQGSPGTEFCRNLDEGPQFSHTFPHGLAVMETEVTRGMWADLGALQPSLPADPGGVPAPADEPDPVAGVSWYQAILFANLLSAEQGLPVCYYTDAGRLTPIGSTNYTAGNVFCDFSARGYRLPAEGEWEYFCRAGTSTYFSKYVSDYGNTTCNSCLTSVLANLRAIAWYCANSGNTPQPVKTKQANPWGLYDVHGNVWEWCWDWSGDYPGEAKTFYTGPDTGTARVLRGGACDMKPLHCRSAYRNWRAPDSPQAYFGFRLVRTL